MITGFKSISLQREEGKVSSRLDHWGRRAQSWKEYALVEEDFEMSNSGTRDGQASREVEEGSTEQEVSLSSERTLSLSSVLGDASELASQNGSSFSRDVSVTESDGEASSKDANSLAINVTSKAAEDQGVFVEQDAVEEQEAFEQEGAVTKQEVDMEVERSKLSTISWLFGREDAEQELVEGATIVDSFTSQVIQHETHLFPPLFPDLSDNNMAFLCLARLGLADRYRLRAVSKVWRAALTSEVLYSARTATGLLEENFAVLMFCMAGPYLRIFNPVTGETLKVALIDVPTHVSLQSLRLTVAGRMVYLYSTESDDDDGNHFIAGYDSVKSTWHHCHGLGRAGKFLVAAADWISGQLFVVSNDVSGMMLGKRPECEWAMVQTWDPASMSWEHCDKVPAWLSYCHLTSAASAYGSFFLFMIEVVSGSLRAVRYDPLDKSWTTLARFPTSCPHVTSLNGEFFGLASGVVWRLEEDNWEYLANLPRHINHCRVHRNCQEGCKTISHCEELVMRLSGELCAVRCWLSWVQEEDKWTVKTAIHILDTDIHRSPPVPATSWETLDFSFEDGESIVASCGVTIC